MLSEKTKEKMRLYSKEYRKKNRKLLTKKAREYHRKNPHIGKARRLRYKLKNRKQFLARRLTSQAIFHGRLKKLPCKICGKRKVEAHHLDYSNWRNIMWLCRPHHRAWHRVFVC